MQIKELLLGVPILMFVWWVFAAPVPQERIVRGCEPIHWVGNLATSTTALVTDGHTQTSVRWSDKLNYSCQYMVWRLIYQEDYNRAVAAGQITPQKPAVDGVISASAVAAAMPDSASAPAANTQPAQPAR